MKKVIKKIGIVLAVLIGLIIIGVVGLIINNRVIYNGLDEKAIEIDYLTDSQLADVENVYSYLKDNTIYDGFGSADNDVVLYNRNYEFLVTSRETVNGWEKQTRQFLNETYSDVLLTTLRLLHKMQTERGQVLFQFTIFLIFLFLNRLRFLFHHSCSDMTILVIEVLSYTKWFTLFRQEVTPSVLRVYITKIMSTKNTIMTAPAMIILSRKQKFLII